MQKLMLVGDKPKFDGQMIIEAKKPKKLPLLEKNLVVRNKGGCQKNNSHRIKG